MRTPQDPPISFRPPRAERNWLRKHKEETGEPVNRVLLRALQREIALTDQAPLGRDQDDDNANR